MMFHGRSRLNVESGVVGFFVPSGRLMGMG